MRTFLFFAISTALMVLLIHWLRSLLCRQRDLWVKGSPRESLPMVMRHIDNSSVDVVGEREISAYLYPEE